MLVLTRRSAVRLHVGAPRVGPRPRNCEFTRPPISNRSEPDKPNHRGVQDSFRHRIATSGLGLLRCSKPTSIESVWISVSRPGVIVTALTQESKGKMTFLRIGELAQENPVRSCDSLPAPPHALLDLSIYVAIRWVNQLPSRAAHSSWNSAVLPRLRSNWNGFARELSLRLPFGVKLPVANRRFDRCTGLSDRSSAWRNSIFANCGRDNESFSIVNNECIEGSRRAFDDSLLSLNEVENIDCPQRVVRRRTGKPVPARFNEFQFV
jgi:hypothetical protein